MITYPAVKRVPDKSGLLIFEVPKIHVESQAAYFERNDKKHGGFYTVKINTPRRPRTIGTNSQNHRVNGFIQQIAVSTGQPFEDIKKRAKQIAVGQGYPIKLDASGQPCYDLWGNVDGISEADSSVEECIILINAVEQIAAFCGVVLREANDE